MTPEELRAIMEYLRQRVRIGPGESGSGVSVAFDVPAEREMVEAGLNAEGAGRLLRAPWWEDLVKDVVETPQMCEADDPPERILEYARDVISEYIRKRFPLHAG